MPVITDGARGVGVDATGTDFPLVRPSDDIKGLLADFYLSHQDAEVVLPLRLTWVYGFCRAQGTCGSESSGGPGSHDADVIVMDADNRVVFDSTTASVFRNQTWGDRLSLFTWESPAAVCRALVHQGVEDEEDVKIYPISFEPESAILDERCSSLVPARVSSLSVADTSSTGDIELTAGHNVRLEVSSVASSIRNAVKVTVTVEPGAGLGRFPSCEEPEESIRYINGVGPDASGNFVLTTGGNGGPCVWTERPGSLVSLSPRLFLPEPATLKLNNNCLPCCECDDFANTYKGLRNVYTQFKTIGRRGQTLRSLFAENRDRWLADKACRAARPTRFRFFMHPGGYVDAMANYANMTKECQSDVTFRLKFTHNNGESGEIVEGTTMVSAPSGLWITDTLNGAWSQWTYHWDEVKPGRTIRIRTRLFFQNPLAGDILTGVATPLIGLTAAVGATTERKILKYGASN